MKGIRKFEIITIPMILLVSLFVLNSVSAQAPETENQEEVIEQVVLEKDEVIKTAAFLTKQFGQRVDQLENDIREIVKNGIDKNIIAARRQINVPAYELQKAVDPHRQELFTILEDDLNKISLVDISVLSNLSMMTASKLEDIRDALLDETSLMPEFDEEQDKINQAILDFQSFAIGLEGDAAEVDFSLIYQDTDNDGVSDYDEKYIFETDPASSSTAGDGVSDSQKILSGTNPVNNESINYENARESTDVVVTDAYDLETIALIKQGEGDIIDFKGRALPNSFVTLYIYSTPIIVTVKSDASGNWEYQLDQELENGEHQLYVATVNNSGKILARSNPISFTKTAEAASIGIVGIEIETSEAGDFFRDNFILISLAVLIAIIVSALMIVGRDKKQPELSEMNVDNSEKPNEKESPTDATTKV